MNEQTSNTKRLRYAFPTSQKAAALGHNKTGCYYIERPGKPDVVIPDKLFVRDRRASAIEAIEAAEAMPEDWHEWSFKRHHLLGDEGHPDLKPDPKDQPSR